MRIRMLTTLLVTGLLAGHGILAAQEDGSLTLEECLSEALSQHPLLLSAVEQHLAARAREAQAHAFPQPSLDLDYDLQPRLLDFRNAGEAYAGFSQTLEFPGKRILRGMIARRESNQALLGIDLARNEVVFQVSASFLRLLLAQEKLATAGQNLELARDFARLAEVKCSAGDVAQVEVLRARVEASRAANDVRASENELAQARAGLNYWLGRRTATPVVARGTMKRPAPELDIERLKSRALALRPDLRKIDEALRAERLKRNLSFLGYLPDLDVGVARHRIAGEPASWDVTLSLAVPLFFWQPLSGEIAEARARAEALKQEARDVENAIVREVEEACRGAQSAREQIELFERDILTQSEKSYEMLLLSFREGEIGGLEIIEARRTLLEARKTYADTLFLHSLALAALEKSVGERLGGGSDEETKTNR